MMKVNSFIPDTNSEKKSPCFFQPKLSINQPNDVYEQEADAMAEKVMRMPVHDYTQQPFFKPAITPIQLTCAHCEQKEKLQREEEQPTESDNANALTEKESKTGETKLSESGRRFYQPLIGSAIDSASLHVGGQADELAKLSKAKALTFGNDIYIPKNKFAPDSSEGRALIGHELTHVKQSKLAPAQIFRDELEPHYPSADEQAKIEKLLGRERTATTKVTETVGEHGEVVKHEEVVMTGKDLTADERVALAKKLKAPFDSAINDMVANAEAGEKLAPSTIYNDAQVYAIAEKAKKEIYQKFGKYITRSVTLTRTDTSVKDRIEKDQILVKSSDMSAIGQSLARTVVNNFCPECERNLAGLNSESRSAVVNSMARTAVAERPDFWEKAAKLKVGGAYTHSTRSITMPYAGKNILESTVHELIHALAHPAFRAAFGDEDIPNEGFTEYFAQEVETGSSYPDQTAKLAAIKSLTNGPFLIDSATSGSTEESLRLAYFSGRLDLIGWKPTSDQERDDVQQAGGAAEWDPDKAKEYASKYKTAAIEKQDAHNNILGVGVYFEKQSGTAPTFNVRYARVLTQTQPYSRGRLLLEGQFEGSPVQKTLGGSLGIAGEYQEPYFYATGGARFTGQASLSGDPAKVNFSPFVGVGIRAWQRIRVGAEGFVLLPLTGGGDVQVGGGATVGLEF